MDRAWHLRQDGKAFPVKVHMYCMDDEDLSSEAEASAFIISSDSKDQELAEYVLDAWMAMLIEQVIPYDADNEVINKMILQELQHLPYHFQYALSADKLLAIHNKQDNYKDVDTFYEFIDKVRDNLEDIQQKIKRSLNQQFCRVRFGGQYNSVSGNREIWFRVSSVGYNWANTIYVFVSSIKRSYGIEYITICRDSESDNNLDGESEFFYKAKDGTAYLHMPINEFLEEEHEHSLVFDSNSVNAGVLHSIWRSLNDGETYDHLMRRLKESNIDPNRDVWRYFLRRERLKNCVLRSGNFKRGDS